MTSLDFDLDLTSDSHSISYVSLSWSLNPLSLPVQLRGVTPCCAVHLEELNEEMDESNVSNTVWISSGLHLLSAPLPFPKVKSVDLSDHTACTGVLLKGKEEEYS